MYQCPGGGIYYEINSWQIGSHKAKYNRRNCGTPIFWSSVLRFYSVLSKNLSLYWTSLLNLFIESLVQDAVHWKTHRTVKCQYQATVRQCSLPTGTLFTVLHSHFVCPTLFVSLCLPHFVCLTLFVPLYLSHFICPTLFVPLCLSNFVCPTLFVPLLVPLCLSHFVCPTLFVLLCLSDFDCPTLFVPLLVPLCLSHC